MNILLLVTELNSANGICTQSVMREMVSRGHTVYCLTNHEKHGDLDKAIRYCYVKPRLVYRLLNGSDDRKIAKTIGLLLNKVKLAISYPTWPLISPLYARRIYRAAKAICQENHIDMIIPIYTQIDTLIAANRIKKEMPDIRYIPYFLDSLSGGYGPKRFSKEWVIRRGIKWEEKLLPSADKIVMMESSRPHYEKYCSEKSYFTKIIFSDLPLISQPKELITPKQASDIIELLYIGSIPSHIRNPEPFLKVFHHTKNERYRLSIIGTSTCGEVLSAYAKRDSRIVLCDPISHDEAMKRVADAAILVNLGNNIKEMTPSKIFEYMSYGKPIISTMPISEEPSASYLRQYPSSYLLEYKDIDYEVEAVKMEEWIDKSIDKRIDFSSIETLFLKNTPAHFCDAVIEGSDNCEDS